MNTLDCIQEELDSARKTFETHKKDKDYGSMAQQQSYINGLEFAKKALFDDIRAKAALNLVNKIANTPIENWFDSTSRLFHNEAKNIMKSKILVGKTKTCNNCHRLLTQCNCKFIVRLYDGFDNEWIDVSDAIPFKKAHEIWLKKTKNGTEKTTYSDIDYYKIFKEN